MHDIGLAEYKENIRRFIHRSVGNDHQISDGDNIFERRIVTSAFSLQLVMYLESEFGVTIDNDDLDIANFASINAMADFMVRKSASA